MVLVLMWARTDPNAQRFQRKLLNSLSRTKENVLFLFLLQNLTVWCWGNGTQDGGRGQSVGLRMGDGIQGGGLLRGGVESV